MASPVLWVAPPAPLTVPSAEREPDNPALAKYALAAEALTGQRPDADPERVGEALDAWLEDLEERLRLPGLAELGLAEADHDAVVDAAMKGSSMKGNPITLTRDELLQILRDSA